MITIWKFRIDVVEQPSADMPVGARVLSVGEQDDEQIYLWALVNTQERRKEKRHFFLFGTGNPIEYGEPEGPFIGTVQTRAGLVWHVFDQRAAQLTSKPEGT